MCESKGCVCEVVKLIDCIQKKHKKPGVVIDSCDKPFLGNRPCEHKPNTRPFILYTPEGRLWKAFFKKHGCMGKSPFFRVEKIDGCCATLRVLKEKHGGHKVEEMYGRKDFVATDSFITINLDCTCAIQCLDDTNIDLD